jgi:hypothetical protein
VLPNVKFFGSIAQAQPPPSLRGFGFTAKELDEKRREFFNCASECGRKQGAKYRIPLDMSIECRRQRAVPGSAPNGAIEVYGLGQEPIVSDHTPGSGHVHHSFSSRAPVRALAAVM